MSADHKISGAFYLSVSLQTFHKRTEHFNTNYKISPYHRRGFTTDHRDIVGKEIYKQYLLNVDARPTQSISLDAPCSSVSSASATALFLRLGSEVPQKKSVSFIKTQSR